MNIYHNGVITKMSTLCSFLTYNANLLSTILQMFGRLNEFMGNIHRYLLISHYRTVTYIQSAVAKGIVFRVVEIIYPYLIFRFDISVFPID